MKNQLVLVTRAWRFNPTDMQPAPFALSDASEMGFLFSGLVSFIAREAHESTEDVRAIIPYVVLHRTGANGVEVCSYRRPKGGEPQLTDQRSIGWGGHVEPKDWKEDSIHETARMCAWREVSEEARFMRCIELGPSTHGLIINNADPVGRRHLGIAMTLDIGENNTVHGSDEAADIQWHAVDTLDGIELESWSRILAPHLAELIRSARPKSGM